MGANESTVKSEQEKVKQYELSCRYELMRQDLMKLAGSLKFNTVMGTEELSLPANKNYPVGPDGKKLKPCCACPETKRARDACIMEKGQEHCTELIEAHKACMRSLGFNI